MTAQAFPVESYREAAAHLRRPFEPAAVRWKVQTTSGSSGLIVGYIDARLAAERLNLVCPHLWSDDYTSAGKGLLLCRLTVDGITRRDVGEGAGKALFSDAFKRAAVKFGVGVSLYALPQTWLTVGDGHLRAAGKAKERLFIQPAGIEHLRSLYGIWLGTEQGQSFGEPLGHGDAAGGSVGDPLDPDAELALEDAAAPRDLPDPPPDTHRQEAPLRASQGTLRVIRSRANLLADGGLDVLLDARGFTGLNDLTPRQAQEILDALDEALANEATA